MCDVAYCLLVDRVMAERQVEAAAGVDWADMHSIEDLDRKLGMVPARLSMLSVEERELRLVLGLSA